MRAGCGAKFRIQSRHISPHNSPHNPRHNPSIPAPVCGKIRPRTHCLWESCLIAQKYSYDKEELLNCGHGHLFGPGNAQLPLPDMLMFDRIVRIDEDGGKYGKGSATAELDISPEMWFFKCHFEGDPVMPGCLGVDALWQLVGFSLGWRGGRGYGRALGAGEIRFTGQISPANRKVTYHIDFKHVIERKVVMGIADGTVVADGQLVYFCKDLRVGLFRNTDSLDEDE